MKKKERHKEGQTKLRLDEVRKENWGTKSRTNARAEKKISSKFSILLFSFHNILSLSLSHTHRVFGAH